MQRSPLIGISIIAVVLLILGSLTNVIGYQVVQSSNQKIIKDVINQKELLFQTFLDIINNKNIQDIIKKSENRGELERFLKMSDEKLFLFKSKIHFGVLLSSPSIFTKNYLENDYSMDIRLLKLKAFNILKLHLIFERFKVRSQLMQKEIISVIEKSDEFNEKIKQLLDLPCECERDNNITRWSFPVICTFLFPLYIFAFVLGMKFQIYWPMNIMILIGTILDCFWPHS